MGDCVNWYVRTLVGINPDPAAPGFKHIIFKPHVVGDLTFAEARYDSVRGPIFCRWNRDRGEFRLKIAIPANTKATIYLPTSTADSIREGGKPVSDVTGVVTRNVTNGAAVIDVGSGSYEFVTDLRADDNR
jgi:alpha-L-rhamnosidase